MPEDRHTRRLRLLSIVRDIEHRETVAELVTARARDDRARELTERTDRLALEYYARRDAISASELAAQRRMAEQLIGLRDTARVGAQEASMVLLRAHEAEHRSRHRRDRVKEHLQALKVTGTSFE